MPSRIASYLVDHPPPASVARALDVLREALRRALRLSAPPAVVMVENVTAAWRAQAIAAAAQLGIADAIGDGEKSAAALASDLTVSEDGVYRLLRALCQDGIFCEPRARMFRNNALSSTLRTSVGEAPSIRDFARFVGSAAHRLHWSSLDQAVRHGSARVKALRGVPFFEYIGHDLPFGELFGAAMSSISGLAVPSLLAAYDFSRFGTLVDVGGGRGVLLGSLLARYPDMRGCLVDMPEVVARAPDTLREAGVAERCEVVSGSFFDALPAGRDAYLMKHILHDWDDEHALRILQRVRAAMRDHSTLLIVDAVLPEGERAHLGKLLDLEMLLAVDGRERTEAEFRALLARAGLVIERVYETASPLSIMEARAG